MKKASRNEIKFGKALRSLKRYSKEDWKQYSNKCNTKGATPETAKENIEKVARSIYYGQPNNRFNDLKHRKNWCIKHPTLAKEHGARLEAIA